MINLSLLMIVRNGEGLVERSLDSVKELVDEMVVVDNGSTDNTIEIVKKYGARVESNNDHDLGKLRKFGLEKTRGEWVMMLDSDEVVSAELSREIKDVVTRGSGVDGYFIPYQNHFLGKPLHRGGEDYKILRLFRREAAMIDPALLHEKVTVHGKTEELKGKIYHYSYRSLKQVFGKFTAYGVRDARQRVARGEKTSLKKIFMYPAHMFWARYVEDKGYKDGLFRIPLDIGFAYMEFLSYFLIIFLKKEYE